MKSLFPHTLILLLTAVITLLAVESVSAQESDIDSMLDEASELVESADESGAMEVFKEVLEIDPQNSEAIWNVSVLYAQRGNRADNEDAQQDYFSTADEWAEKCLEYHPDSAACHFSKAVAIGRKAQNAGTRDRIRMSEEIKEHADRAVDLDPDFFRAWHLLGVWHTEVANLNWAERTAARAIFGGLPEGASNEKAEEAFQKAMEMNPNSILIHLDFAIYYEEVGEDEKAIELLEKLLEFEPKLKDDEDLKERARELLADLQ